MMNEQRNINKTFVFSSDQNSREPAVRQISDTVVESGTHYCLTDNELRLVIDEAVTNAMEHGNHWNRSKMIEVKIMTQQENLLINITDEGTGFDTSKENKYYAQQDKMSARGRGILLMTSLCCVGWNSKGNGIYLTIPAADECR